MTLLEMTIALGLLSIIFTLVLGIYVSGLRLWSGHDARAELLQQLQVANLKLRKAVESSTVEGLSLGADAKAVSIISPLNSDGLPTLSADGSWQWSSWQIYSHHEGKLKMARILWQGATPSERSQASPVEIATSQPLSSYIHEGKTVARNLHEVKFSSRTEDELLYVDWDFRVDNQAKTGQETMQGQALFRFRN